MKYNKFFRFLNNPRFLFSVLLVVLTIQLFVSFNILLLVISVSILVWIKKYKLACLILILLVYGLVFTIIFIKFKRSGEGDDTNNSYHLINNKSNDTIPVEGRFSNIDQEINFNNDVQTIKNTTGISTNNVPFTISKTSISDQAGSFLKDFYHSKISSEKDNPCLNKVNGPFTINNSVLDKQEDEPFIVKDFNPIRCYKVSILVKSKNIESITDSSGKPIQHVESVTVR